MTTRRTSGSSTNVWGDDPVHGWPLVGSVASSRGQTGTRRANGRDLTLPSGRKLFMGSSGTGAPLDGRDPMTKNGSPSSSFRRASATNGRPPSVRRPVFWRCVQTSCAPGSHSWRRPASSSETPVTSWLLAGRQLRVVGWTASPQFSYREGRRGTTLRRLVSGRLPTVGQQRRLQRHADHHRGLLLPLLSAD